MEYGLTDSYGDITTEDTELVTSPSVEITGLDELTEYHFKVNSKDELDNLAESADNTFTTLAPPGVIGGSFEDYSAGFPPDPWEAAFEEYTGTDAIEDHVTVVAGEGAHGGTKYIQVTTVEDAEVWFGQTFRVEPGVTYELSGWFRSADSLWAWEEPTVVFGVWTETGSC